MTDTLPPDDDLAAAEYALGVMPAAERALFAARLDLSPELRTAVSSWEIRLAALADQIPEVAPPPQVKAALMTALFTPETEPRAGFWENLWLWRTLTGVSLAALAVMAGLYLRAPAPPAVPGAVYVAELASDKTTVRVIAYYDAQSGTLRLDRRAGEPAAGRAMELWLIAGTDKPKSLGLMPATETGSVVIPTTLRDAVQTATLAVSDEPAGGSPTGQPTGAVLAAGKVHSL